MNERDKSNIKSQASKENSEKDKKTKPEIKDPHRKPPDDILDYYDWQDSNVVIND
jgi:hypothetical protein